MTKVSSHPASNRKKGKIQRAGVLLAVLSLLGGSLLAPREARAQSRNSLLETMGVSIAMGTVLGASTLPFYDQPGSHLSNLALGAGLGALTGLGVHLYGRWFGPSHEDDEYAARPGQAPDARNGGAAAFVRTSQSDMWLESRSREYAPGRPHSRTIAWMPLVSLNW
jgi:hypothetical protein